MNPRKADSLSSLIREARGFAGGRSAKADRSERDAIIELCDRSEAAEKALGFSISTTPPAPRKTTAMESHNHSEGEG